MIVSELSPGAIGAAIKDVALDRQADRRRAVERYQGQGLEDDVKPYFSPEARAQIVIDAQKVARRFVDKRFSVYQEAPERVVEGVDDYAALQGDLDRVCPVVERLSGVLGTLAMLVTVTEEQVLHYLPLVEFEPVFLPDDPEPMGIAYPLFVAPKDGQVKREDLTWVVWTDALHFICSGKGLVSAVVGPDGTVNDQLVNPYGVVPVVYVHREPNVTNNWWGQIATDLLSAQTSYNVLMAQGNLGAMFQSLGQPVITGVNDKQDVTLGAERMLFLPPGASFDMVGPPGGLAQLEAWMRWKLDSLAATMGLKIKWADGSGGATSGEHQRMLEIELTTSIMSDFALWQDVERERHRVARAVYQYHFNRDLGERCAVNFTEPNIPQSPEQMRAEFEFELSKGLCSLQDYYRRKDPSADDDQIAALLTKVNEERAAFAPAAAPSTQTAPARTSGLAALLNQPVEE